jgi:hypothetical protein
MWRRVTITQKTVFLNTSGVRAFIYWMTEVSTGFLNWPAFRWNCLYLRGRILCIISANTAWKQIYSPNLRKGLRIKCTNPTQTYIYMCVCVCVCVKDSSLPGHEAVLMVEWCLTFRKIVVPLSSKARQPEKNRGRAQLKPDGTRWRTVGEVKGKHASGVGSQ